MKSTELLFITIIFFIFVTPLNAKKYYTIQLATGHCNESGFEFINKQVQKLDKSLKKEVRIILDNGYYILYACLSETKSSVQKVLPRYKKIFKDAYIRKHDPSKVKLIKKFLNDKNLQKSKTKDKNLLFSNDMLIDRTIYALYISQNQKENIALIALELHNDFTMHFRVLIGEDYAGEGKFFVDFQGRFYVYSDEEKRYKDFYVLKEKNKDFMVVEAWEDGKKTNNKIRFFYSLAKAQQYLDNL